VCLLASDAVGRFVKVDRVQLTAALAHGQQTEPVDVEILALGPFFQIADKGRPVRVDLHLDLAFGLLDRIRG
jgi:hypothetical protein